jgi:hypothetical protein
MIPSKVRLLESAAKELRALSASDPAAFTAVVQALHSLAKSGPPPETRRIPVNLPFREGMVDFLLFGYDVGRVRVLFEGERIVTRSLEGWDMTRALPRAGEGFVYTIWAIVTPR